MSPESRAAPADPWAGSWEEALTQPPPDLSSATLENYIDAQKLAFLATRIPRSGCAVEVGCGSARLLARVGQASGELELVAVDSSAAALELCAATERAIGMPMRRVQADARRLPLETGSCDIVLSGGLLEHFENPRPVVSEMVRILRPGGVFYSDVVPRKLSLYRLREARRMLTSPWLIPGVFESSLGDKTYRKALAELGCTEIDVRWCGVYPPGNALAWARRTTRLDGTAVASMLGWYFMVAARKA